MPLSFYSIMNYYYHKEKSSLVCNPSSADERLSYHKIYSHLNAHGSSTHTHNLGFYSPHFMADTFTIVPQVREIRV